MERDFKGIWIPKDIWLSKDLTLQEKVFYVEIDSLDNHEGCYANNQYFSDFFGLSKTRVSLIIKSLQEKGYINSKIIYKEGSKQILKRVLNICYRPYLTNVKDPTQQMLKDNNIINNTTNNITNKTYKKPKLSTTEKTKLEIDKLDLSDKLRDSLKEFVDYRKEKKKEITIRSIKMTLKKLNNHTEFNDEEHLIASIEQSIERGYLGIFATKENKFTANKNTDSNFRMEDIV